MACSYHVPVGLSGPEELSTQPDPAQCSRRGKYVTDVLIAGGGVAGSSLAIMLGRRGLEVELFERARFPREKPCGEGLMPGGVAVLDRLGITNAVAGMPFYGVRYHCDGRTAQGRFPKLAKFGRIGIGQRRKLLDHILFSEASATPGVRVHREARVEGPMVERGRVVGLIVEGQTVRAPLVVAADGMHSVIRQKLGLSYAMDRTRFGVRTHFRLSADEVPTPWVEVFIDCGREIYVTPLPNNEITLTALSGVDTGRDYPKAAFLQCCCAFPALAYLLEGAQQVSATIGASPLNGRARVGVASGVVLLGDASGFTDPVTGGGMSQALMTAELLAEYISSNRSGDDEWLWSFEKQRRRMLWDYRFLTKAVLQLSRRPHLTRAVLSVLRRWPGLLSHGIAVAGGTKCLLGCAET